MPKFQPIQFAFNGGEFGQDLFSRPDFPRQQQAVSVLEGFIPKAQGGVERRGGFHISALAESQTGVSFLVPFRFKNTQSYILEFSDLKMRVFRDNFLIIGSFGSNLIINGTFPTDILSWINNSSGGNISHDATNFALRTSGGAVVVPSQYGEGYQAVSVTPGSTYQVDWDHVTITNPALTSASFKIGTTPGGAEIFNKNYTSGSQLGEFTQFVATGSTVYISCRSTNAISFSTPRQDNWDNIQLRDTTGGIFELTTPFTEADLFQLKFAQTFDVMYFAHPSHHPQKITRVAHDNWTIANVGFSNKPTGFAGAVDEYPAGVGFHGVRLGWCGTNNNPLDTWLSKGDGSIEDMNLGAAAADDAVNLELFSDSGEALQWLKSLQNVLIVGSSETEHSGITPNNAPVTPTNLYFTPGSNEGSANIMPIRASGSVVFAVNGGKILYELVSNDLGKFAIRELTITNPEVTGEGIVQLAWQKRPDKLIWAVTAEGKLISLTFNKEHEVFAWARHPVDGVVESIAVISTTDGLEDQLWISVLRNYENQVTTRQIEFLDPEIFVDNALKYSGAPSHTFSGLDHLDGQTVQIVGDNKVFDPQVVTGGNVTIDPELPAEDRTLVSEAYIGVGYGSKLVTMPMDVIGEGFNTVGFFKQWVKMVVRFKNTLGGLINGEPIIFREEGDLPGAVIPAFTGLKTVEDFIDWDKEGKVTIEQPEPLPMTISSISGIVEVSEP